MVDLEIGRPHPGGHEDDRDRRRARLRAQPIQSLEPVHLGHHHIQQIEIGDEPGRECEHAPAIAAAGHLETTDPAEGEARRRMITDRVRGMARMAAELTGEAVGSRLEVASLQDSLAVALTGLGAPDQSVGLLREACQTRREELGPDDPLTLTSDHNLAVALMDGGELPEALRLIEAPLILALGFAGARLDHGLAAFSTLVARADRRCILLGPKDFAFAAPPHLTLDLRPGEPLSLFPMAQVTGASEGLEWPIAGIRFAPDGMIGTSNRVIARRVELEFDQPGMLVILPRRRLDAAIRALRSAP